MQANPFGSRWIVCLLMGIVLFSTTPLAAAPGGPPPQPTVLHAQVVVNGGPTFFSTSFEGLGDIVSTRRDDDRGQAATLRGRVRFFRGFTTNRDLWDWRQQVLDGQGRQARHDVTVVLFDQTFAEVARWELKDAWPKSVSVSLAADGSAQEELELAYSMITRP